MGAVMIFMMIITFKINDLLSQVLHFYIVQPSPMQYRDNASQDL